MAKGKPRKTNSRKRKTKDKGDEAEMRKGNSEPMQIELNSEDFAFHFKNAKAAKVRMGTAKSSYDACLKAAKKVSDQLHASVKLALTLEGKDLYDVKTQLEVFGFVLKATDHPLQLTIHDTLLGDVIEVAATRGFNDGRVGKPCANPYPDGTELARAYLDQWGRGQQELLGVGSDGIGHNSQNDQSAQQAAE